MAKTLPMEITFDVQIEGRALNDDAYRRLAEYVREAKKPRVTETWHSATWKADGSADRCVHSHETRDGAERCAAGREWPAVLISLKKDMVEKEWALYDAAWSRKREQTAAEAAAKEAARVAEERAQWAGWADGDLRAEEDARRERWYAEAEKARAATAYAHDAEWAAGQVTLELERRAEERGK